MAGVDTDRELIARDYVPVGRRERSSELVMAELAELSATDLLDLTPVARTLGFGGTPEGLDAAASPRGHRLLARVPRLPGRSSTASSSTSAACRSCWPRASRNFRSSTASARPGRGRCARRSPGWPRCRSSTGTRDGRARQVRLNCAAVPSTPDSLAYSV